jgi:hypothetical protein
VEFSPGTDDHEFSSEENVTELYFVIAKRNALLISK